MVKSPTCKFYFRAEVYFSLPLSRGTHWNLVKPVWFSPVELEVKRVLSDFVSFSLFGGFIVYLLVIVSLNLFFYVLENFFCW